MMKRLLLVDGHNYLFRAYFGVPDSAKTPNGTLVNAIYGFFAFLRRSTDALRPSYLLIVFDSETGIADKQKKNINYKANRELVDTGMFEQLKLIKEILDLIGIKYIEDPNYEADDVIGSVASSYVHDRTDVYISSNDFDFMQLVKPRLWVVREIKGKQEYFDQVAVKKKFSASPSQYLDYLTLKGDASDNIPGIPGIGPKTAAKLVNEFSSLENLLDNTESIKGRIKNAIEENSEYLVSAKQFLKINSDLDIEFSNPADLQYDFNKLQSKTNIFLKQIGVI